MGSQKIAFGYKNLPNIVQYNIFKKYPHYNIPYFKIMAVFYTGKKLLYAGGEYIR